MAEILAVKNGVTLPREMAVAHAKDGVGLVSSHGDDRVCGVS
jgi:xanthine dehydrogenase accessory factor